MKSAGSWVRNCGHKPRFIAERMREYPGHPIVWLDADARVRRYPQLFDELDCDFAAHWRHGVELLSGTMYFGPTYQARLLVEAWCSSQAREWDTWDQRTLQRIIESGIADLRIVRLPSTYTRIFDDPKMGEPVIEHLQASRKHGLQRQAV